MSSSPIVELLGSPQVVVGFGATTLILLATTFFYLKNNDGSNGAAASSSSALEKAEELDREVRLLFAIVFLQCIIYEIQFCPQDMCSLFILFILFSPDDF